MISWEVHGPDLSLTISERLDRLRNLKPALLRAGLYQRDQSVKRITQGGPGWPPDAPSTVAMKGSSKPGIDTGTMRSSLTVDVEKEPNTAVVGISGPAANKTSTDGTPLVNYAYWFQYGTGEYAGHSRWTIRPVNAKVLSWTAGGKTYFARSVEMVGQPPRPFLYITTTEDAPMIARIIQSYIATGKAA